MQFLITESKSPEEMTGRRPSEQFQITSMTPRSFQTSSPKNNLGTSRLSQKCNLSFDTFCWLHMLTSGALQTERENRTSLSVFVPPLELLQRKDPFEKLSLRKPSENRSLIRSSRQPCLSPQRQVHASGEAISHWSGLLQSLSQATILRCFCGKLPAQG